MLQRYNTYDTANQVKTIRKKVVVGHKDDASSFLTLYNVKDRFFNYLAILFPSSDELFEHNLESLCCLLLLRSLILNCKYEDVVMREQGFKVSLILYCDSSSEGSPESFADFISKSLSGEYSEFAQASNGLSCNPEFCQGG